MSSPILLLITLPIAVLFTFILVARIVRQVRKKREVRIGSDFGIDELHKLMAEGKISPEEFERARDSVLMKSRPAEAARATPARAFEVQPIRKVGEQSAEESE